MPVKFGAGPVSGSWSGGESPSSWSQKLPGPGESFEMKMGLLGLSHRESWNEILIDRVGGRERKEEEGEGRG